MARYARGRDYHYAHRDRMKALRKRLLALDPSLETYACVDTGVAMEKPWAERAGLGWIGKNGCLITRSHGSWVTLSVMFLDRAVDALRRAPPQPVRRLHPLPGRLPHRGPAQPRAWWTPGAASPTRPSRTTGWSRCRCGRGCAGTCSAATSARRSVPSTAPTCPRATPLRGAAARADARRRRSRR